MSKKIIYYNKSITKQERGLFFDSFKHLKINLSTLLEHFNRVDFYNNKSIIDYLNDKPNSRKAKFPDIKKIGLIDYTKQEQASLTMFGQKIKDNSNDNTTLGLLILNYCYEGSFSSFRPYYVLLQIIYEQNLIKVEKEKLLQILAHPIIEVLKNNFQGQFYDNLTTGLKEELKRPVSYIFNYLQTIKLLDSDFIVDKKFLKKILNLSRVPLITSINSKNYQSAGRHGKEQEYFRSKLLKIYDKKCFIRDEEIIARYKSKEQILLDAAHIVPYSKGGSFSINNGVLLSYDLHKLFDLGLITIEHKIGSFYSKLSEKLNKGSYLDEFNNKKLEYIPDQFSPNLLALEYHNKQIFKN